MFVKPRAGRLVNLNQAIQDLRAERSQAQKEVDRLEKAIGALGKLGGNPGLKVLRNETGKRRRRSAAVRKRMSKAQKARWTKLRQQGAGKG